MPASTTSKWGRNGEERAALLRVRTGLNALRAVGGSLRGIAREREKINRPNTLLAIRRTKGQSNSREELAGGGPAHPAGGRRQGWGERGKLDPREGIPYHTANRSPVSNQRLPEILDGWHPPGGSQLNTRRMHPTGALGNWGWGRGGEKAHRTGESPPVKLLAAWAAPTREGTKRRCNRVRAFVEYLKTGTTLNTGPAPYRAAGSLSSVDGESTHTSELRAKPVWPEHCECSPRRPAIPVCSAPSSPQQDWNSEPEQETTSARLCQGRN